MPELYELGPFVVLGLLGWAHCAGMCGGFACGVCLHVPSRSAAARRLLWYGAGKAATYSVLGVAVAVAAARLGGAASGPGLAASQRAFALIAGAVLVVTGLSLCGVRLPRPAAGRRLLAPFTAGLAAVRALPGAWSSFGTGLLTGLLPCGLTWAALGLAATVPPATAGLGTLAFGLATLPALAGVALGGRLLQARSRAVAVRLGGPLVIALGVLTAARGLWTDPEAPCHAAGESELSSVVHEDVPLGEDPDRERRLEHR